IPGRVGTQSHPWLPADASDVSLPAINPEPRDEIAIRPFRNGDEQALTALFEPVIGRRMSEHEWRWMLAPTSKVPSVWLATHDERPIFQYAAMHTRFKIDERTSDVMISVDTMTAPEFRRRGLLTKVAAHAYEKWRDSGVAFVIGLPNQQWGSRTVALGWRE